MSGHGRTKTDLCIRIPDDLRARIEAQPGTTTEVVIEALTRHLPDEHGWCTRGEHAWWHDSAVELMRYSDSEWGVTELGRGESLSDTPRGALDRAGLSWMPLPVSLSEGEE